MPGLRATYPVADHLCLCRFLGSPGLILFHVLVCRPQWKMLALKLAATSSGMQGYLIYNCPRPRLPARKKCSKGAGDPLCTRPSHGDDDDDDDIDDRMASAAAAAGGGRSSERRGGGGGKSETKGKERMKLRTCKSTERT